MPSTKYRIISAKHATICSIKSKAFGWGTRTALEKTTYWTHFATESQFLLGTVRDFRPTFSNRRKSVYFDRVQDSNWTDPIVTSRTIPSIRTLSPRFQL